MTNVTLDVKQVKFVLFLCLIRTTETQASRAILHRVVIADKGLQIEAEVLHPSCYDLRTTETIL